jgi:hypothetical protein
MTELTITAVLAFALAGCGQDDPAPSVAVESATPDRLTMSDDAANDVTVRVRYDDADGDLGGGTAEVHDCRGDQLVTSLPIPPIAPDNLVADKAHITGTLELHVNDIGAARSTGIPTPCYELGIDPQPIDQTVLCVFLIDAAGHHGAGDCTKTIALFM